MASTEASNSPKIRKVQLQALTPANIPANAAFTAQQSSAGEKLPALVRFITELLNEGIVFSDSHISKHFSDKGAPRPSPPSTAKVQLLASDALQSANGKSEAWFARQSMHDNDARTGTGTFDEFKDVLLTDHSIHEKAYTPDVFDANRVADWSGEITADAAAQLRETGFEDVVLEVYEMAHKIPAPLNNRVFSVVIVRARTPKSLGFVVVQIPIDLSGVEGAKYALDAKGRQKEKVVHGAYCAVERVKRTSDGVLWEMATASDAKGNLPMAVQNLASLAR